MVNLFIILIPGRTGSTYLRELLDSHPNIRCGHELFGGYWRTPSHLRSAKAVLQIEQIYDFLQEKHSSKITALGFKTKGYDVLDKTSFSRLLKELKVNVIHMQRRNIVKEAVSAITSRNLYQRTNKWNLFNKNDGAGPFKINIGEFTEFFRYKEHVNNELNKFVKDLRLPTLAVYYEDLLADKSKTLRSIFRFLKVPYKKTCCKVLKNTPDDLTKIIINFDEIKSHYVGTPYEAMFNEIISSKR